MNKELEEILQHFGTSVPLTNKDLERYYHTTTFDDKFKKQKSNLSEVQHREVKTMKPELEDILQQSGVKGMKWGKRKATSTGGEGSAKAKGDGVGSKVKAQVNSLKREHGLKKTLKNADKMSTKEIQKVSARAQIENDLKRLSKERGVGSKKDKKDYLNRANMGDQEIFRKVQRLRAKSSLKRNASEATKSQKEIAKKVLHIAAPLVLQYALTKSINKKDVMGAGVNAAVNLGGAKAKLLKNLVDQAKTIKKTAKHSDSLDDVLLHSLIYDANDTDTDLDDILQHHGVKGMKWGRHLYSQAKARGAARKERIKTEADIVRRRKSGEINRKQANNERWDAFHKEQSHNKHYKKEYERRKAKGQDEKRAMRGAYTVAQARKKATMALVTKAAVAGLAVGKVGAKVGKEIANNPENIRKAKNVAQALKRSPIRYVDGKAMKNVIN